MTEPRGEKSRSEEIDRIELPLARSGAYEFPALDEGPGCWESRWVEFKRLLVAGIWEDKFTLVILILSITTFVLTILWELLFG